MTTSDSDHGARYRKTVMVSGRRTSISVEGEMWKTLGLVCKCEKLSLSDVLTEIDQRREGASLASAIRSSCIYYWRAAADHVHANRQQFGGWPRNSLAEAQTPFVFSHDEFEVPFPIPPEGVGLFSSALEAYSSSRRARLRALAEENQDRKPATPSEPED